MRVESRGAGPPPHGRRPAAHTSDPPTPTPTPTQPGTASAASLLSAFHPLPAAPGAFPTQRYRLLPPATTTEEEEARSIRLLLKPVALDIPALLLGPGPGVQQQEQQGQEQEAQESSSEPALVLYGRAVVDGGSSSSSSSSMQADVIHSLALRVGEFLALAPVAVPASSLAAAAPAAQAGGDVDSQGRVVVRIKGSGGGEAWWCRLGALGDRWVDVGAPDSNTIVSP